MSLNSKIQKLLPFIPLAGGVLLGVILHKPEDENQAETVASRTAQDTDSKALLTIFDVLDIGPHEAWCREYLLHPEARSAEVEAESFPELERYAPLFGVGINLTPEVHCLVYRGEDLAGHVEAHVQWLTGRNRYYGYGVHFGDRLE